MLMACFDALTMIAHRMSSEVSMTASADEAFYANVARHHDAARWSRALFTAMLSFTIGNRQHYDEGINIDAAAYS